MKKVRPKRLGDLLNLKRGYDLPESKRKEGSYPVISSAGISGYHSEYKIEGEGVVIGRYGTLGDAHYIEGRYWPHNTSLYVTDFKGNCPRYIYYLLTCIGRIKTSDKSAVPGVNRNELHEMAVPAIDDVRLQKKIAYVLATLDAKVELNNRINEELEGMAKLLYDYWFVQFDFPITAAQAAAMGKPKLEGKPYRASGGKMIYDKTLKREIPVGWEDGNILAIAELGGGATPSKKVPEFWGGDIPFFTPTDAESEPFCLDTEDHITQRGLGNGATRLYPQGTLFITARGSVGKAMIISRAMAMNQSCYALCPRNGVGSAFLYFHTLSLMDYLHAKSSGSVFNSIVTNDINFTPALVPASQQLTAFNEVAEPMFKSILTYQQQNQQLAELRDWLLPMLMNGQVTVG